MASQAPSYSLASLTERRLVLFILDFLTESMWEGKVVESNLKKVLVAARSIGDVFDVDPDDDEQREQLSVNPADFQPVINALLSAHENVVRDEKSLEDLSHIIDTDSSTDSPTSDHQNGLDHAGMGTDPKHAQYSLGDAAAAASTSERGLGLEMGNTNFKSGQAETQATDTPGLVSRLPSFSVVSNDTAYPALASGAVEHRNIYAQYPTHQSSVNYTDDMSNHAYQIATTYPSFRPLPSNTTIGTWPGSYPGLGSYPVFGSHPGSGFPGSNPGPESYHGPILYPSQSPHPPGPIPEANYPPTHSVSTSNTDPNSSQGPSELGFYNS